MDSADIPRLEWNSFLVSFLERHRDGLVNVRIESRVSADSADARERTLVGIKVDEDAGRACLAVRTLDHVGRHALHSLDRVTRLRLLQDERGAETALFAESADARFLVHFVLPLPGAIDGIDATEKSLHAALPSGAVR